MVGRSTSKLLDVSPAVLRRLAVNHPQRYPALLESAVAGPLGKVTILAAQPQAVLWSSDVRPSRAAVAVVCAWHRMVV